VIEGNLSDQVISIAAAPSEYRWNLRKKLATLLAAAAVVAVGFAGTCCLLRLLIPHPINLYAEIRSEKLALAKQWIGLVSVAAFGSSHVDCGFDPRVFDKTLVPEATHPISINLGVSGGIQIEQTAVAREYERLLASASTTRDVNILLMEVNTSLNFTNKVMTHPRSINIYDSDAVRLAFQFSDPKLGRVRALGRSSVALLGSALNFMNVGMLSNEIFPPPLNAAIVQNETVAGRRGLSPPPPSSHDARDADEIHALVAGLKSNPQGVPAEVTPGLCAEASSLESADAGGSGRHHYRVIYFVTPKLTDLSTYSTYPDALTCGGGTIPIVNVALPGKNPQLYEPVLWHDLTHLNERGARLYSKLLAQAVRDVLATSHYTAL
jgi:hypothetical protein